MAKFAKPDDQNTDPAPVAPAPAPAPAPVAPAPAPAPAPAVTVIDVNNNNQNSSVMAQQTVQMASVQATAQAQASVGLAQTAIDKEIVEQQLDNQDEHWVKAYWRPAMGWLYMGICFMDFIGFPLITMFLPVIFKGLGVQFTYAPWQSLTLSNGGLIHLAFGAILGVTSFMRGQEKLAKINGQ